MHPTGDRATTDCGGFFTHLVAIVETIIALAGMCGFARNLISGAADIGTPKGRKPGRPPIRSKRRLIDGIRWRTRVGCPWRDVPDCYGPWQSVYGQFCRWQRDGTWAAIVTGLQTDADAAGRIGWDVSVDSTIARAHQHAAGARDGAAQKEPPGGVEVEPGDHALGRSRGGSGRPRTRPDPVLADKAYPSKANRAYRAPSPCRGRTTPLR